MSEDFITCRKCDFEWHKNDGPICPICAKKITNDVSPDYHGGMFGTGHKPERLKKYYQAIGLLALVYVIYLAFRS